MLRCFGNIGFLAFARVIRHAIAVDKVTKRLVLRRHKPGIYRPTNQHDTSHEHTNATTRRHQSNKQTTHRRWWLLESIVCIDDRRATEWQQMCLVRPPLCLSPPPMQHAQQQQYVSIKSTKYTCIVELSLIKTKYIYMYCSLASLHAQDPNRLRFYHLSPLPTIHRDVSNRRVDLLPRTRSPISTEEEKKNGQKNE